MYVSFPACLYQIDTSLDWYSRLKYRYRISGDNIVSDLTSVPLHQIPQSHTHWHKSMKNTFILASIKEKNKACGNVLPLWNNLLGFAAARKCVAKLTLWVFSWLTVGTALVRRINSSQLLMCRAFSCFCPSNVNLSVFEEPRRCSSPDPVYLFCCYETWHKG